MAPTNGKSMGPGGLRVDASVADISRTLKENLRSVPNATGINNHMGSAFTQNSMAVKRFVQALSTIEKNYFIIDSLTIPDSRLYTAAKNNSIPAARRTVFLAHTPTPAAIKKQLEKLVRHAREFGTAIAITHPHTETLEVLEHALPKLPVKLVHISALLKGR